MKRLSGKLSVGRAAWVAAVIGVVTGFLLLRGLSTMQASPAEVDPVDSPAAGTLLISEIRLRSFASTSDEFIEVFNNSGSVHTVSAASGTGYAIAASDGIVRCSIPNNTVIPNNGHYLCVNSAGYNLDTYPAGNGTTATGNATYTTPINDNVGVALFNNNTGGASFNLANRFDAIGSTADPNPLYKEGTGHPILTTAPPTDHSLFRSFDPATGKPVDTDNNAADFLYGDPNGTSIGAGQRLAAPGPQNLSSPIYANFPLLPAISLDASRAASAPPNRVRDLTSDAANNSTFGTVTIRRRFVNDTGANITRLRFRVTDLSTFPSPAIGVADLRMRSSSAVVVAGINDLATCAATGAPATPPCTLTVQGTTLEQPPGQPNGGGFNSSLSAGTVTLGTPLPPNASLNLQFLMGVQANGAYRLGIEVEALPVGGGMFVASGNTSAAQTSDVQNRVSDFDGDGKSDVAVFRPGNGNWFRRSSGNGVDLIAPWGLSSDLIAPGDYNGDGMTDLTVFRPTGGIWFINTVLTTLQVNWGLSTDLPAQGDYDGDRVTDIAVFRPSTGEWFLRQSTAGFRAVPFGLNGDRPVPADYDGDGKTDVAVFRPSTGIWYLNRSLAGPTALQFGTSTDLVVPADYDGDGKADVAVFRPSTGQWYIQRSSAGLLVQPWGANGDIPTPGDYDGDGKADITIWRPANGTWFRLNSANATFTQFPYGINGDRPIAAAYVPVQ